MSKIESDFINALQDKAGGISDFGAGHRLLDLDSILAVFRSLILPLLTGEPVAWRVRYSPRGLWHLSHSRCADDVYERQPLGVIAPAPEDIERGWVDDLNDPEVPVTRSLLAAACAELRKYAIPAGADDQVVLNLEASIGILRSAGGEHVLYTDADKDRPEVICDRNGRVVLGMCKQCGRAESQLEEPCSTDEAPAAPWTPEAIAVLGAAQSVAPAGQAETPKCRFSTGAVNPWSGEKTAGELAGQAAAGVQRDFRAVGWMRSDGSLHKGCPPLDEPSGWVAIGEIIPAPAVERGVAERQRQISAEAKATQETPDEHR